MESSLSEGRLSHAHLQGASPEAASAPGYHPTPGAPNGKLSQQRERAAFPRCIIEMPSPFAHSTPSSSSIAFKSENGQKIVSVRRAV